MHFDDMEPMVTTGTCMGHVWKGKWPQTRALELCSHPPSCSVVQVSFTSHDASSHGTLIGSMWTLLFFNYLNIFPPHLSPNFLFERNTSLNVSYMGSGWQGLRRQTDKGRQQDRRTWYTSWWWSLTCSFITLSETFIYNVVLDLPSIKGLRVFLFYFLIWNVEEVRNFIKEKIKRTC